MGVEGTGYRNRCEDGKERLSVKKDRERKTGRGRVGTSVKSVRAGDTGT